MKWYKVQRYKKYLIFNVAARIFDPHRRGGAFIPLLMRTLAARVSGIRCRDFNCATFRIGLPQPTQMLKTCHFVS